MKENILALAKQGKLAEATAICETATREDPENPELWHILTMFYGKSEAYEKAVVSGSAAVRLAPGNTRARFNLGRALLELGECEAAIRELGIVVEQDPGNGWAHSLLGHAYSDNHQEDKAIEHYVIALKVMPDETGTQAWLALAYEKLGRMDAAMALVDRILSEKPDHVVANMVAAKLERRRGENEAARDRLQKLLSLPVKPRNRMSIINLLAQVLDRMACYPEAWQAFQESQSIAQELAGSRFRNKVWFQQTQIMSAALTAGTVRQWPSMPVDDGLPMPRFLVGFPRSGTTLTEQILSTHSAVISSDEQGYIPEIISGALAQKQDGVKYPFNIRALTDKDIAKLRLQYWKMVEDMQGPEVREKVFLDKLPLNIIDIGLIHRMFPDAPVLVLLRDPRDACLSAFMQRFEFNDAMSNFFTIEGCTRFYNATMGLWLHYKRVLENLDYLEVRYEDLVTDLPAKSAEILEFMGLDWEDGVLEYFKRNQRKINTPSYQDVRKPVYTRSLGRWKHYREFMQESLVSLAPFVEEFGYSNQ